MSALPYASAAVIVNAWAAPAVWLAAPVTTRRVAAAALTVTPSRSEPAALIVPSVTATVAASAL